jgi:hypothetical protein
MEQTNSGYQKKMDLLFAGAPVEMNDRYSNVAKTVFVSLMYYALLPTATLISSVSFFLSFWADKYGLLRTWKQSQAQSGQVAEMMVVFVAASIVAHMLMSKFVYSAWPFDGVCEKGDSYETCSQLKDAFALELKKQAPYTQKFLTDFYQWSFLSLVGITTTYIALFKYRGFFHSLFHATIKDATDASDEKFSRQRSISLYVPELQNPYQVNPLLACDMTGVDTMHLSWVGDYEANNLFTYAQKQAPPGTDLTKMFSVCKQYVHYDDRLAFYTMKIQRARRSKLASRQSIEDAKLLVEAEEKEELFQLRAKQTSLDMERLESAIQAAEKAKLEGQENEARNNQDYQARLAEMNEKLKKLDQLAKLDEMHEKLQV